MRAPSRIVLATFLLLLPASAPLGAQDPKPAVGDGLRRERERLAGYKWRLKTEMTVDDILRIVKLEDVHLAPDGSLVKDTVRYEHRPQPTPYPENDPRYRVTRPATDAEDQTFFDQAVDVMQQYARVTPERLDTWAAGAEPPAEDPERKGQLRLHGRGLLVRDDDAVLYIDGKTKKPVEVEIKTAVGDKVREIGFIRVVFDTVPPVHSGLAELVVPKNIFLNLTRGRRSVKLEMETSDYRTWP